MTVRLVILDYVERLERRTAAMEADLWWIKSHLDVEAEVADRRFALSVQTRDSAAGPLDKLRDHAERMRYAPLEQLGDMLRNAAGDLHWFIPRGQLDAETALRFLAEACDGRLSPDEVAAIFLPAVTPPRRGRA